MWWLDQFFFFRNARMVSPLETLAFGTQRHVDSNDFPFQLVDFSDDILVGGFNQPNRNIFSQKLDRISPGIRGEK